MWVIFSVIFPTFPPFSQKYITGEINNTFKQLQLLKNYVYVGNITNFVYIYSDYRNIYILVNLYIDMEKMTTQRMSRLCADEWMLLKICTKVSRVEEAMWMAIQLLREN